jgi:hypothetical protein
VKRDEEEEEEEEEQEKEVVTCGSREHFRDCPGAASTPYPCVKGHYLLPRYLGYFISAGGQSPRERILECSGSTRLKRAGHTT